MEVGKVLKRVEAKMGIFYRKKYFTPGKKLGKITLPPQKNMPVMPLFPPFFFFFLQTQ